MNPNDDDDDEFDKMDHIINSSGCAEELYDNKECFMEKKDWRLCKESTDKLKECMQRQQQLKKRKNVANKNVQ